LAIRAEIVRQLRQPPPLAFIDGQWVSPLDLVRAFEVEKALAKVPTVAEETREG
jgi:hypothetical protein